MEHTLIIVSGMSCTGKTSIAHKIGDRFNLPVYGRDDFKESLFDSLGYSNREWSKKLGIASYQLLYLVTEQLLSRKQSVVIESNFKSQFDSRKFKDLKEKYQCSLLQIHCYVETSLALQRFENRACSRTRHPGHVDESIYEEMKLNFEHGGYEILDICDRTFRIDTSNFECINYQAIFSVIQNYLSVT